jgi:glyoxylase-like metal-dependent hydrolase (beta-lactamase superfamily II)
MANPQERALHYPFADRIPAPAATIEAAPGVLWLRMALPFALDHINLWLLADEIDGRPGWTVVDCGMANEATRAHWDAVFARELRGLPVLRVVATHMHPDHIGLAHWLTERWSTPERACRLWISATDWNAAQAASRSQTSFGGEATARFFARHGLADCDALAKVRARSNYYAGLVPSVPRCFRRLMDGMALTIGGRRWQCIVGYGHAPEHISLHCEELRVLISGDMVLPRISTNVRVYDVEPEANPLRLYLDSIDRLCNIDDGTLVLPSHGKPFIGLRERVAQLHAHHDGLLAEVVRACSRAPCSAADVVPILFGRSLDLHQTTFALGEAIAHMHALVETGRLRPEFGDDGVHRFVATA